MRDVLDALGQLDRVPVAVVLGGGHVADRVLDGVVGQALAEVLTRQRALATAYRLGGSVGLSFTFGSIYNTIVNPRLDELGT